MRRPAHRGWPRLDAAAAAGQSSLISWALPAQRSRTLRGSVLPRGRAAAPPHLRHAARRRLVAHRLDRLGQGAHKGDAGARARPRKLRILRQEAVAARGRGMGALADMTWAPGGGQGACSAMDAMHHA